MVKVSRRRNRLRTQNRSGAGLAGDAEGNGIRIVRVQGGGMLRLRPVESVNRANAVDLVGPVGFQPLQSDIVHIGGADSAIGEADQSLDHVGVGLALAILDPDERSTGIDADNPQQARRGGCGEVLGISPFGRVHGRIVSHNG